MLQFGVRLQQTHFSVNGEALQVRTREGCFCLHLSSPIRRPEQIVSKNTFHFEKLVLHEFALLPSSGKLFRTSDTLHQ